VRKYLLHIVIFLLSLNAFNGFSQDAHFTQFYANPIFLNPAFTGVTYEHRLVANYRNQWPGISNAFKTFAASYDYNMSELRSGFGLQLMRDRAGTSLLTTTSAMVSYAYHFQVTKFQEFRMGLQLGYINKYNDPSRLIFNDQLYSGSTVSLDLPAIDRKHFIDINAGVLLNSTEYWLGVAAHNINSPNTSLIEGTNRLPTKISAHGGYRFIILKKGNFLKRFFSPAFNYRHQQKFDQLDIGAYYFHYPINLGLWYRGLPLKHYKAGYANTDAVSVLFGVDIKQYDMRVGLSYDVTLSRLSSNSFGAIELSIIYEIAKKSKKNRKVLISCPKF